MSPYDENVKRFVDDLLRSEKNSEKKQEMLEKLLLAMMDLYDRETRIVVNAMIEKKYLPMLRQ